MRRRGATTARRRRHRRRRRRPAARRRSGPARGRHRRPSPRVRTRSRTAPSRSPRARRRSPTTPTGPAPPYRRPPMPCPRSAPTSPRVPGASRDSTVADRRGPRRSSIPSATSSAVGTTPCRRPWARSTHSPPAPRRSPPGRRRSPRAPTPRPTAATQLSGGATALADGLVHARRRHGTAARRARRRRRVDPRLHRGPRATVRRRRSRTRCRSSRARSHRPPTTAAGLAPFFAALAGWIGIYALFLIVKPISRRAVTALHSPIRVTAAGWLTPAILGGLQMAGLFARARARAGLRVRQPARNPRGHGARFVHLRGGHPRAQRVARVGGAVPRARPHGACSS